EALRPSYLQGVATSLGGGTHFWLAGTLPPAQSRLRTTSQDRRNHGLSGHDSAHAQTSWLTKNDFSNRLSANSSSIYSDSTAERPLRLGGVAPRMVNSGPAHSCSESHRR